MKREKQVHPPTSLGVRQASAALCVPEPSERPRPAALADAPAKDLLLWQLADSAFPTGGFAHSAGLEAAWQHGEVKNRTELMAFLETSLHQVARAALPFVVVTHAEPTRLAELDRLCDAFLSNHVANRASRLQGRAFLTAIERIYSPEKPDARTQAPFQHFTPVFGACLQALNVALDTTLRLFVFNHLRGLLAAAVRLNIVGPMEAQKLQHQLSNLTEELVRHSERLSLDDLAQTAPLPDLWQGAQDRLYSRLFQS